MLTRDQFNQALWGMIGTDRLKEVVDGIKGDVGEAFGFQPPQEQPPSPQEPPTRDPNRNPLGSWLSSRPQPAEQPNQWHSTVRPTDLSGQDWHEAARGAVNWFPNWQQVPETPTEPERQWHNEARGAVNWFPNWQAATPEQPASPVFRPQPAVLGPQPAVLGPQPAATTPTPVVAAPAIPSPAQTGDPWERAFAEAHGRAPTNYDAMVKGEMDKWIQQGWANPAPSRGDWERLTRDLNRRGIRGPSNVPDFAPGYSPTSRPATVSAAQPVKPATTARTAQPVAQARTTVTGQGEQTYRPVIEEHAKKYGVDPDLVASLIQAESSFNPTAKGGSGEVGLMQLMPATAAGLGLTPDSYFDPRSNIDAGTKYFASQLKQYEPYGEQALPLALAAYNAGGARVNAFLAKEKPLPESTIGYVEAILNAFKQRKGAK